MTQLLQVKDDERLAIRGTPAAFTFATSGTKTIVEIDRRQLAIRAVEGAPVEAVAAAFARVPKPLRDVLRELFISPTPNPADAIWVERYRLPVNSAMGAVASGTGQIVIYPRGLAQLGTDGFVRGLMHELGHCWALRAWADDPRARQTWLDAMAADAYAPSLYAQWSFENSGSPDEDVAEAASLYHLVLGSEELEARRASMPARFALLDARFGGASQI